MIILRNRNKSSNIIDLINNTKAELPFTDIYYLLGYALHKSKEFLFTHPDYVPSNGEILKWNDYKRRRVHGEPASYITGEKEFYSLLFKVNRYTLIPRPETEILVDEVISLAPKSLLDIGTGSGNIAIVVKNYLKKCSVVALDISERALKIARENEVRIIGENDIIFLQSDYFQRLVCQKFDVIASNPPYVKSEKLNQLPREIKEHEPRCALDGGPDGLNAFRIIMREGKRFLEDGGRMLLELDQELLDGVVALACENHYMIEKITKDLSGCDRMIMLKHMIQ